MNLQKLSNTELDILHRSARDAVFTMDSKYFQNTEQAEAVCLACRNEKRRRVDIRGIQVEVEDADAALQRVAD